MPPSVQDFFKSPSTSGAALSPDGRFIAVRVTSPRTGRAVLATLDAATLNATPIANYSNADVGQFHWLNNERLTFTLVNVDYRGDAGRPGYYAVNRDGSAEILLSEALVRKRAFAENKNAGGNDATISNKIYGFPWFDRRHTLVVDIQDQAPTLKRMDTRTRALSPIKAPLGARSWLIDQDGKVRVAMVEQGARHVLSHKDQDGAWHTVKTFDLASEEVVIPQLYDGATLYVRARNGGDKASIYRYDMAKKFVDGKPLIVAPEFDVDGNFITDAKKMLGYRFHTDAEVTVWLDQDMKAIQDSVDRMLPATINRLSRGARSETPYVLIDSYSDVQPHIYLLFNTETKKVVRLGAAHPDIDAQRMGEMNFVRYTARDGLAIPAYITTPRSGDKTMLPMVVLVGDMPWERSAFWAWEPDVQFLASRGYAVLQPQPRGINGFGAKHHEAGKKQWGRATQDDIADGVKWAVAQGVADPARVCIAGTGYGGYAALMGLINDPALFKCGISWSGITDLALMADNGWQDYPLSRADIANRLGEPATERASWQAVSPLALASRIKQPLLLAHGKFDSPVPIGHGRKLQQALSGSNPALEWIEYTEPASEWSVQKNRVDLWTRIERFLGRHIGAH